MKKNSKSAMKKEQKGKRAKAQRPVQREPKEVLAELVEKLQGKLELKATSARVSAAAPISTNGTRNVVNCGNPAGVSSPSNPVIETSFGVLIPRAANPRMSSNAI